MTPTSTLSTIMDSIITTFVDLITIVFTDYWGYVIVLSVIAGFVVFFRRKVSMGSR